MDARIRPHLAKVLSRRAHKALMALVDLADDRGVVDSTADEPALTRVAAYLGIKRSETCEGIAALRTHKPPLVRMLRSGPKGKHSRYLLLCDSVLAERKDSICEGCKNPIRQSTRTWRDPAKWCSTCRQTGIARSDRSWQVKAEDAALDLLRQGDPYAVTQDGRCYLTTSGVTRVHLVTGHPLYGSGENNGPQSEGLLTFLAKQGFLSRADISAWRARERRYRSGEGEG